MKFSAVFGALCILLLLSTHVEGKFSQRGELVSFSDFTANTHQGIGGALFGAVLKGGFKAIAKGGAKAIAKGGAKAIAKGGAKAIAKGGAKAIAKGGAKAIAKG